MNLRIVTITPDKPYTLEADEKILERNTSYGADKPSWNLLIAKGDHKEDGKDIVRESLDDREARREARRDAHSERVLQSFANAFAAFAATLKDQPSTSSEAKPIMNG
jgi:hypothetical protein